MYYKSRIFTGRNPEECYEKFMKWRTDYTPVDDKFWERFGGDENSYWLTIIYHDDATPHM